MEWHVFVYCSGYTSIQSFCHAVPYLGRLHYQHYNELFRRVQYVYIKRLVTESNELIYGILN